MMKRRTAVFTIGVIGLGSGVYIGNRWNLFNYQVDLDYLDRKMGLLEQIVEVIIPKTVTPGAAECGVHRFVTMMVKEAVDIRTQINFVEGLRSLENYTNNNFDKAFHDLDFDQKISVIKFFENRDKPLPGLLGKAKNKFLGKSFFSTLKEYTSIGYFTSKPGATQALSYVAIPTKYLSCVDISEYPKSWATE